MTSEESGLMGKGGAPMIAVKVDRCCNRYWRLFLFLGLLLMSLIVAGMLLTGRNEQEQLLNDAWKDHWSEQQSSDKARKTVIEQQGRNVVEKDETFDEYIDSMDDHDDGDDILIDKDEYYDDDRPDIGKGGGRSGQDYLNQIQYDQEASKRENINPAPLGVVTEIKDYSQQDSFKNLFRQELKETIQFDPHYKNPCWAESIPKYPYQTNSYLMVSEQARLLEPQFQQMRKIFATRKEDNWRLRCLPYYYVMETPPSAVPSLYTVLGYHPSVANPRMSEPEFWNIRGPENTARIRDYLDLFDNAAEIIRANTTSVEKDGQIQQMHKIITGDGTSSYLWTINSWKSLFGNENLEEPKITTANLIKMLTPSAKIIIVLRNPTDRLFQGYLQRTENPTGADFHEKVGQALEAMSKCVEQRTFRSCLYDSDFNKRLKVRLRIGMYYPFIEDYINTFGRDQVKVIRYEDYIASTSQVISEVCTFLGLQPYPTQDLDKAEKNVQAMENKRKDSAKAQMMSTTRAMLKEFHKVLNEKLAEVLGDQQFTWPENALTEEVLDHAKSQFQQQQQQQQATGGQQQSSGGQGPEATNRPKTFQEMLDKIRKRQRAALEQQQALRRRQMERIEELRKERAERKQKEAQQGQGQQAGQQSGQQLQAQQPGQPQQGQQPGQPAQGGQSGQPQQPNQPQQQPAGQQQAAQSDRPRPSPLKFPSK